MNSAGTTAPATAEGVIYQATYRLLAGRPVVHWYGALADGDSFLIRDHRHTPYFYIRQADRTQASRLGAACAPAQDGHSFAGVPVVRVETATPAEVPALRDRLQQRGIATFEADVRFAYRPLIDQGLKGSVRIVGERRPGTGDGSAGGPGTRWIFDDPQLQPAAVTLSPKVLAFDIETNPREDRLLAISVYGCGHAEVLLCDPQQRALPPGCRGFVDERSTLVAFMRLVARLDPDVLTGWNVIDFDLTTLLKVARRVGVQFELGREPGAIRLRAAQGYFGSSSISIPGRLVLDGLDLLRGAFVRMEDYSLDAVARSVLGEGKILQGHAKDRVAEILHRYQHDLPGFAAYSLTDSRLVLDILARLQLVELAFERSRLTGMMPDRVAASIASFDFLYLSALHQRRIVAPTLVEPTESARVAQTGGQVFEPLPGLYQNVWVFDFKSLYPSVIRTFNIDPVGYVAPDAVSSEQDLIEVAGAHFRRAPGVLPGMLDELFPRREAAKARLDAVASQAIKILMNSFYGVLGTSACRFFNPHIANAITGQGRLLLRWARQWFEGRGFRVLYGDTDSLFVLAGDSEDAQSLGRELAGALNRDLAAKVRAEYGVESRLELEFEKLYTQLLLPALRGGSGGARKRYVGRLDGQLEFVGMEVVRRDWTDLAKQVQRELYERLFAGRDAVSYLVQMVTELRAGQLDALLVYRKGLRKPAAEYTANTPPHVQAMRKSLATAATGRRQIVEYVITSSGPEPLDNQRSPLDREHYVEKQIRPVAEPVLDLLGLQFAQVVGDDTQLGLF